MTVPDNVQEFKFASADYEDVLLCARQRGAQFGLLLRWLSPHTIAFRGARILKE